MPSNSHNRILLYKLKPAVKYKSYPILSREELYNSTKPAEKFIEIVYNKLDKICPEEEIQITKLDGKVKSLALQKIGRQKLREHTKNGNSQRFKALKKKQKSRIKLEGQKSLDKLFENAGHKGTKWLREANRMSSRPGEETSSTFSLQEHIDENLTSSQSAEKIVKYFSQISQEFTPIEQDTSPRWMDVQTKLKAAPCSHPQIEEHIVYQNMKEAKKTDSVPGDIPAPILKEFLPEFATPVTAILKQAVENHTWPDIYKKEYHLPLKKVPTPQNEDDIRGIGLTMWVSKQLERLVLKWIWPYIYPHIDPDQMGGMPGCSVEHYIIKIMHFILSSMDGNSDAAVMAVPVDYSKAFNRMLHSDMLCNLHALNVPNCAIKLIKSYLTRRSMCVTYKGETSSFQSCPGGGPQGGLLT